jgi:lipopolysaccharide/colanic/teichoic acid biosynthesis glycosyltransferase
VVGGKLSLGAAAAHDAAIADHSVGDSSLIGTARHACSRRYVYLKRALDLVLGSVLVIVAVPLFLVISLLILLDGGRPIFYRQERVGARQRRRGAAVEWEERRFRIFKFRTMVPDADQVPVHERFVESFVNGDLDAEDDHLPYKLGDDPRITRAGRFLRATSLDELPQLLNVLGGTMSLVGPRPVPPYEVELYKPRHRERLAALPGITGPWQLDGRGRVSFEEMVRLDIEYVRRRSIRNDLMLLARTPAAVLTRRGAR